MARWVVDLTQTVYESCTVFVEANSQEEAEKIALEKCLDVDWICADVQEREVISAERYPRG